MRLILLESGRISDLIGSDYLVRVDTNKGRSVSNMYALNTIFGCFFNCKQHSINDGNSETKGLCAFY